MTEPLQQVQRAGGYNAPLPAHPAGQVAGPSFADTLRKVQQGEEIPAPGKNTGLQQPEQAQGNYDLRFSNHAQKRMQSREIALTDEGLSRLSTAVDKAEQRGGKESLVLMDELAFIVNIRERLVVTAIDAGKRGEGVFTQIDSVVIAGDA